jgi:hypothetical protein
MADSRDRRNYGCGRRLDRLTIARVAEKTAHLANRGSGLVLQTRSALGRLGEYLQESYGIRNLENCTYDHIVGWVIDELRPSVIEGEISRTTASCYLASINTVFKTHGRHDISISAKEFGISRGKKYTNVDLSNEHEDVQAYRTWLQERATTTDGLRSLQYQALAHSVALEWSAGLRFRESMMVKIDSKDLSGALILQQGDGCKNNRPRLVHALDGSSALHSAQRFISEHIKDFSRGSLIPSELSYKKQKSFSRNALQTFRDETGRSINHHGNRHYFAHETYARLWEAKAGIRIEAPIKEKVFGGDHITSIASRLRITESEAKELDNQVRLELSGELGHNRIDVTWSYIGR